MAEILTESFCERCGTRYTFEAAIPKNRRIGRLKVLSKGLKNYVLSEDASLDEALAEARSEDERELSGGQLDAFHDTFQFCMSCRQYTCANCWNELEGRCLSCAPLSLAGTHLRSPLDDLLAGGGIAPLAPFAPPAAVEETPAAAALETNGHATLDEPAVNGSAWPTIDLFRTAHDQTGAETAAAAAQPEAVAEATEASVEAPPIESPAPAAEIEAEAPAAGESIAAASAEAGPTADFWARPFTGFAPQPEPTNGHHVEAGPAAEEVEPAAVAEPAPVVEPDREPAAVVKATAGPEPAPEAAAESITLDQPGASVHAEPRVEPVAAAEPEVAPVAADQALEAEAEARATELAERTSRLLGRFRVQPRSAGATAGEQAAAARAAADVAAAREAAAAAAAQARAAIEPQVDAQPGLPVAEAAAAVPPVAPAPPARPSWMFVSPAPEPEPAPEPALPGWPEPVAWGDRKSSALDLGSLDEPSPVEPPAEPAVPIGAEQPAEAGSVAVPVAAPAQPAPEPVLTPEPSPAPVAAEPAPPPLAATPATDWIEMPAWPTPARPRLSDSAPVPPQPVLPVVQPPAQAPQWPAPLRPDVDVSSTPFWAAGQAGRSAGELDVWDASAREVTNAAGIAASPVGVQACVSCGLSLSATARFCRRCGSRQG